MEQLSLEQQEKLKKLEILLDTQRSFLVAKTSVMPVISSLSATILVVATFNERLLQITQNLKIALIILLLLIPLSLIVYNAEYYLGIRTTQKEIDKVIGKKLLTDQSCWQRFYGFLISSYSFAGTILLTGIIAYIIFEIWRNKPN